jgi:exosome complex component CSL4
MNKEKKVVTPGEVIATTEEFLPGEGTYELKGSILSSFLGRLNLDVEEMVAKVEPINPPAILKVGDIVLTQVFDVKSSMILTNVACAENNPRALSGNTIGAIHISKISEGYTSDVWKEFRIGDVVRARVVQVKPSLQLSTDKSNLGALHSLCTKCRMPLIKKENNLFCSDCQRVELRKIAPDYGKYGFEK